MSSVRNLERSKQLVQDSPYSKKVGPGSQPITLTDCLTQQKNQVNSKLAMISDSNASYKHHSPSSQRHRVPSAQLSSASSQKHLTRQRSTSPSKFQLQ